MALVLHLSDLHLGPGAGDRPTADAKASVVKDADLRKRAGAAILTMKKIVKQMNGERFSAVVLSGDIANQNHEDGFKQLNSFLASIEECMPTDKRALIVVPGNHDVAWKTPPGTEARYKHFLKYVREELGATTSPLEGVDNLSDGGKHLTQSHFWYDKNDGFAILALNSSDYCGSWAGLHGIDDKDYEKFVTQAQLKKLPKADEILRSLDRLRTYDMARISPLQIDAFRFLAAKAATLVASPSRPALLMATLHHQLLPVGDDEEIKPFEGLTNLGEVRSLLAELNINLVLHGHKHVCATYWDKQEVKGHSPHEMLVLSGPTVCGEPYTNEVSKNPCSILKITPVPGGHTIDVQTAKEFLARDEPLTARFFEGRRFIPPSANNAVAAVAANSFDDAYAALQALPIFQKQGAKNALNLSVHIKDALTVKSSPPIDFPVDVVDDRSELDVWFEDIAQWWQGSRSELSPDLYFTHGMRIHNYKASVDQLNYARDVLQARLDENNGKAIVCLIDPEADFRPMKRKRLSGWFPAFAMAQFYITQDSATGQRYVNVTGFYRKQEMRYWWAINVRELRLLLDQLAIPDTLIGSITTIATIAHTSQSKPRAAISVVDQWYDADKEKIANLVQAFIFASENPASGVKKGVSKDWRQVLKDLIPPSPDKAGSLENIPIATSGLSLLVTLVRTQGTYKVENQDLLSFGQCLDQIMDGHNRLQQTLSSTVNDLTEKKRQYKREWIPIEKAVQTALTLVEKVLSTNE